MALWLCGMSNGQRAPWNNVDVTKCTRTPTICNDDILILEEFNKKWCIRQGALQRKVHINVHFVHSHNSHPHTEESTECL